MFYQPKLGPWSDVTEDACRFGAATILETGGRAVPNREMGRETDQSESSVPDCQTHSLGVKINCLCCLSRFESGGLILETKTMLITGSVR